MVSIKLPTVLFFIKIDKLMIKSTWKYVKKIQKSYNCIERDDPIWPDFRTDYRALVHKAIAYWFKI